MKRAFALGLGIALALAGSLPSLAADMSIPYKAPYAPPPYVPYYPDWSGFYITGHGIGSIDRMNGQPFTEAGAGGGIGYNWQFGRWVVGLQGDIDGFVVPTNNLSGMDSIVSVRGRVGYSFERLLLYATGGWADGHFLTTFSPPPTFNALPTWSWQSGYTAGGGAEYAVTPYLATKFEYLYSDFGNNAAGPGVPAIPGHVRVFEARLGLTLLLNHLDYWWR
jgi:outer membrane immunogenic protein